MGTNTTVLRKTYQDYVGQYKGERIRGSLRGSKCPHTGTYKRPCLTIGQRNLIRYVVQPEIEQLSNWLHYSKPVMDNGQKIGRALRQRLVDAIKLENGVHTVTLERRTPKAIAEGVSPYSAKWEYHHRGIVGYYETVTVQKPLEQLPDHIIQWFSNRIISTQYQQGNLQLNLYNSGGDILETMRDIDGSGVTSCMTGEDCYHYYDSLAYAPQSTLATLTMDDSDGEVMCRCLVWEHDNAIWFDRRYPNHDTALTQRFTDMLKAQYAGQELRFRSHNSLPDGTVTFRREEDGRRVTPEPITIDRQEYLAYFDSFHFIKDYSHDTITLSCRENDKIYGCAASTEGSFGNCDCRTECSECGYRCDEEEMYIIGYGESVCSDCVRTCDYCDEYHTERYSNYCSTLDRTYCDGCASDHQDALEPIQTRTRQPIMCGASTYRNVYRVIYRSIWAPGYQRVIAMQPIEGLR